MLIKIPDDLLKNTCYTKIQLLLVYYFLYKGNSDNFFNDLQALINYNDIQEIKDENNNLIDYEMNPTRKLFMNKIISEGLIQPKSLENETLAQKLKDLYPKGKKPGTNQYWSEGLSLIEKRLQLFFKRYSKKYSDDEIIEATKKYVTNMENDPYMKTLKYFILKNKVINGMIEEESELYNYLENKDEESDESTINWGSKII